MRSRLEERLALTAATEGGEERPACSTEVEAEVVSLFRRLRDRLLRYLLSVGLPVHEGEEIVQDTFLALFRHLTLNKPRTNLDSWLFRVAHNLGLKRRDQTRKSPEVLSDVALIEDCAFDPDPTAEAHLVHLQTQERLRLLVRSLPEQDRRCLALRAEGLRYREIAEVLDISVGSVSISLARSLARLGRAIQR
jgi:RNA polymerase sigma-70 factor (ECF subfamily)